jgi:peroxiredoxin
MPRFVAAAEDIKKKGVDTIACISVNDPFVMAAWARDQRTGDNVMMLGDGNGEFTQAMGLTTDHFQVRAGHPQSTLRHDRR